MRLFSLLALTALFSSFGIARADTFSTFALSATLMDGTANGTLTLDQTTGKFTGSNISVVTSGGSGIFSGAPTSSSSGSNYSSNIFDTSVSPIEFELVLPLTLLKDYTGGSLCTSAALCSTRESSLELTGSTLDAVTSGALTLVPAISATPEPSSLLLLGTGVLVIGSFVRRRRTP